MSEKIDPIRSALRELERAFVAFDKGERNRLYESRDAMTRLTSAVEASDFTDIGSLCEIVTRLLGILLMEGGLDEQRAVAHVRELLAYVESQVALDAEADGPGGVFHVMNSQKLGEILLHKGLIAPEQLEKALLLQRVSKGRRVGQVLIAMNAIDQRTLDTVLEDQKSETRREETRRSGSSITAPAGGPAPLRLTPPLASPPAADGTYGAPIPPPPTLGG